MRQSLKAFVERNGPNQTYDWSLFLWRLVQNALCLGPDPSDEQGELAIKFSCYFLPPILCSFALQLGSIMCVGVSGLRGALGAYGGMWRYKMLRREFHSPLLLSLPVENTVILRRSRSCLESESLQAADGKRFWLMRGKQVVCNTEDILVPS